MNEQTKPRYGIDSYLDWVKAEGLPVVEDYGIDLFSVTTQPWARFGVKAAACHLKGRGDFANMFLLDIAPGVVPQFRSSTLVAQLQATLAGAGLCVLPCFMAAGHPALVPVLGAVSIERTFWLITHADLHDLTRQFIDGPDDVAEFATCTARNTRARGTR